MKYVFLCEVRPSRAPRQARGTECLRFCALDHDLGHTSCWETTTKCAHHKTNSEQNKRAQQPTNINQQKRIDHHQQQQKTTMMKNITALVLMALASLTLVKALEDTYEVPSKDRRYLRSRHHHPYHPYYHHYPQHWVDDSYNTDIDDSFNTDIDNSFNTDNSYTRVHGRYTNIEDSMNDNYRSFNNNDWW